MVVVSARALSRRRSFTGGKSRASAKLHMLAPRHIMSHQVIDDLPHAILLAGRPECNQLFWISVQALRVLSDRDPQSEDAAHW